MAASVKNVRKEIWLVFVALTALTILEVGVAYVTSVSKVVIGASLVLLALAKAACVLLFYMHLLHETKALKKTVILPFLFPALFAVVLIADSFWRGGWAG